MEESQQLEILIDSRGKSEEIAIAIEALIGVGYDLRVSTVSVNLVTTGVPLPVAILRGDLPVREHGNVAVLSLLSELLKDQNKEAPPSAHQRHRTSSETP